MKTRREIVGLLGAGFLASQGCQPGGPSPQNPAKLAINPSGPVPIPSNRVNLICHGMMAFVYYGGSLKIYIPVPKMNGNIVHCILFGGLNGAPLAPNPNGYAFDFGSGAGSGQSYQAPASSDVVLTLSAYTMNLSNVHCWIQLPGILPTLVRSCRLMTHTGTGTGGFYSGADGSGINAMVIPGTHVLSWDGVLKPITLTDLSSGSQITMPGMPSDPSLPVRNIHLYSEPPARIVNANHIPMFCNMFNSSAGKPPDIQRSSVPATQNAIDVDLQDPANADLSRLDLASLPDLTNPNCSISGMGNSGEQKHAGDPADCINGWAYLS